MVDALLVADIHFVLAHVHQGSIKHFWHIPTVLSALSRLRYHEGFPSGVELNCPAFTQDKFEYLEALGDTCNPTLKIPLTPHEQDIDRDKIVAFTNANTEGRGWILKTPFSTNRDYMRRCKGVESIFNSLASLRSELLGQIPYVMLQACMKNVIEAKVVVLNKVPKYVNMSKQVDLI